MPKEKESILPQPEAEGIIVKPEEKELPITPQEIKFEIPKELTDKIEKMSSAIESLTSLYTSQNNLNTELITAVKDIAGAQLSGRELTDFEKKKVDSTISDFKKILGN